MERALPRRARAATRACLIPVLLLLPMACGKSAESPATEPSESAIDPSTQLPAIEAPPMRIAANDADVRAPMDATPSPNGERVYYLALSHDAADESAAGVFSVSSEGGAIETLAIGEPLIAPVGISVSLDGERIFVADSGVSSELGVGAILSLSTEGGAPHVLAGTEGYVPHGLTIAEVEGDEHLYFTGIHPTSGEHGLFRVAPDGGGVETIASGEPFADPTGVTVTAEGVAYVVDSFSGSAAEAGGNLAGVIRVRDGRAESVRSDIGVGFPAGIASTRDGSTVLVSGLDPRTRRDRVYLLNAESLELSVVVEPFAQFGEPAGLHRAHDSDTFAWADSEANQDGTVYVLEL